jgi:hypothetical protein
MKKELRLFATHDEAEEEGLRDILAMSTAERLEAFLELMKPIYAAASGLSRVYRTRPLRES